MGAVHKTNAGLLASLYLAGPACNAFGTDIANLTLEVTYEQQERLVCIFFSLVFLEVCIV